MFEIWLHVYPTADYDGISQHFCDEFFPLFSSNRLHLLLSCSTVRLKSTLVWCCSCIQSIFFYRSIFIVVIFVWLFHFTCMYKTMIFSCDQFCRQLNYTCLILKSLAPICFLAETNLMNNTLWIEKICYKNVFFVLLKKQKNSWIKQQQQLNKKTKTAEIW